MTVATPEQLEIVNNRASSVGQMFYDRVRATPERPAYQYPDADEQWQTLTWGETGERVTQLAAGLVALGIQPEQRVAIASATRIDWILADLAINAAGAATTTVYPTTIPDDEAYILADSDSRVVFAEDDEQIEKLRQKRDELPAVTKVVTFEGTPDEHRDEGWVISLDQLYELGREQLADTPDVINERVAAIKPEDLATLVYTSGTTGRPKGVRLNHDARTYEGAAVVAGGTLNIDDVQFLWLPMAHVFGKVLLTSQLQLGYVTAVDGRVPKIIDNLAVVKPTFMGAAPRIFEKAYGTIVSMMESEGGIKYMLFRWAERLGRDVSRRKRAGKPIPALLTVQHKIADTLVFAKIRERFGGRVKFFISGAAPLSQDIAEWFHAAGILILEGYGLTETAAGSFVNQPTAFKLGTVGLPMPGTDVKIAEDGEVLIKGPGVMDGYHNLEEQSASTLTDDGWLATGDIGYLDEDGFLTITDRKKDLFKTSGGKYVAPAYIEGLFKGYSTLASQMMVYGADRQYCTALITLDPDAVAAWAEENGMSGADYSTVVSSDAMRQTIQSQIDQMNANLNRWETIKKFAILRQDFTPESGELTPSLKVKRKVVEGNYQDILENFYSRYRHARQEGSAGP